ncbi:hypothetical protein [Xylophilus sp. ASV27]|uniref:hypothetical protein n=1 Tax=Xylophilus sp. ASV27 TaxID=2795129 RepID=UPI0018ED8FDB|nr:hypothetical protein [Xylophilus sp. ASV27]
MPLFTLAGLALTALACLCIYAASHHQRLWSAAWPAWPARLAGAGLLVAGWLAFAQDMQRLAATFAFLATLMLAFALLPYIGALFHARRTR